LREKEGKEIEREVNDHITEGNVRGKRKRGGTAIRRQKSGVKVRRKNLQQGFKERGIEPTWKKDTPSRGLKTREPLVRGKEKSGRNEKSDGRIPQVGKRDRLYNKFTEWGKDR